MGDSLTALEPFFRTIGYFIMAVATAYAAMWAVAIAVGAYLLGCIRGRPRWVFAILKLAAALTAGTIVAYIAFGRYGTYLGRYLVYVRYWAGLFCLFGHLRPFTNRFRPVPGILPAKAARAAAVIFLIVSVLIYRDGIVLLLSGLCGGLILWSTRGML